MLTDDAFRKILDYYNRPWAGYRRIRKGVKKRITRHMHSLHLDSVDAYLQVLRQNPQEDEICRQCLLVTISRFLRDHDLWRYLQERLLVELSRRFTTGLRIWSVGCACGEEVYSLAILWEDLHLEVPLEILATDIQQENLARAQAGVYERSSLREVSEEIRNRWFFSCSNGRSYAVRPQLKNHIHWRRHDLFARPPDGPFQLILLRNNLLTYHRGQSMTAAFSRIVHILSPGGCLIVGAHEQAPESDIVLEQDKHYPCMYFRHTTT